MSGISKFLWVLRLNLFEFNGRLSRKNFWLIVLAWVGVHTILWLASAVSFILIAESQTTPDKTIAGTIAMIAIGSQLIFTFLSFLPMLAATARRLHDTNRTARWAFLLIPPITALGMFPLLFFCAEEGDRFDNKYGRAPKARTNPEIAEVFN
ncbi:DUF805 domain-containing protein [Ponticaulis koreensis]|uniref:DUF805 domain-containing protein n=1 Tax=Ponticaulis koreensis TaxID=1123045 RepID=UPI0003B65722|nr:DUF805 domain-containing protein [Ponticaulis koreensis]